MSAINFINDMDEIEKEFYMLYEYIRDELNGLDDYAINNGYLKSPYRIRKFIEKYDYLGLNVLLVHIMASLIEDRVSIEIMETLSKLNLNIGCSQYFSDSLNKMLEHNSYFIRYSAAECMAIYGDKNNLVALNKALLRETSKGIIARIIETIDVISAGESKPSSIIFITKIFKIR